MQPLSAFVQRRERGSSNSCRCLAGSKLVDGMNPLVSIVIPARNDAKALRLTFNYLERLRAIERAEIIVAASGEKEETENAVAGRQNRMARPIDPFGLNERRRVRSVRRCLFLFARGLV